MPGCPYCGEMHSQLYICEAMKAARAKADRMAKVQPDMAKTVHTMAKVVHTDMAKTVHAVDSTMAKTETASTYRYRDADKRRAYQRELMRRRYAEQKR
jgi:hypothetical protein